MKKLLMVFALVAITMTMKAHDYNTGLGLRLGGINSGITIKHFTGNTTALEGIIGFARHSVSFTGLYEKQMPIQNAEGLSWYYGLGGHIGFFNSGYSYGYYRYYHYKGNKLIVYDDDYYRSTTYFGADLILGLEYKFKGAPIALGIDIKPQFDLVPGFYTYVDGALSVRFTF